MIRIMMMMMMMIKTEKEHSAKVEGVDLNDRYCNADTLLIRHGHVAF